MSHRFTVAVAFLSGVVGCAGGVRADVTVSGDVCFSSGSTCVPVGSVPGDLATGLLNVGYFDSGSLSIDNASVLTASGMYIGRFPGAAGSVGVTGLGSQLLTGSIQMAAEAGAAGGLAASNGGFIGAGNVTIWTGGLSSIDVGGAGTVLDAGIVSLYDGHFSITDGASAFLNGINLGSGDGIGASLTVSGVDAWLDVSGGVGVASSQLDVEGGARATIGGDLTVSFWDIERLLARGAGTEVVVGRRVIAFNDVVIDQGARLEAGSFLIDLDPGQVSIIEFKDPGTVVDVLGEFSGFGPVRVANGARLTAGSVYVSGPVALWLDDNALEGMLPGPIIAAAGLVDLTAVELPIGVQRSASAQGDSFLLMEFDAIELGAWTLAPGPSFLFDLSAAPLDGGLVWDAVLSATSLRLRVVTPPPAPGPFSLASPPDGAVDQPRNTTLGWTPSADASSYTVEIASDASFANIVYANAGPIEATLMLPLGALDYDTEYHWRVAAHNPTGAQPATPASFSFTTKPAPPPPGVFSLTSPADGATDVPLTPTLAWTASSDAEVYLVELDVSALFAEPILSAVLPSTETSLSIPTGLLDVCTTYLWRVTAMNGTSQHVGSPAPSFFDTVVAAPPGALTLVSPPDGAPDLPTTPLLEWTASSGADEYVVEIDDADDFGSPIFTRVVGSTSTSLEVPSGTLLRGPTYFWRVTARNCNVENPSVSSAFSFSTAPPPPPGPFSLSSPPDGAIDLESRPRLDWTSSADADVYIVEIDTSDTFSSPDLIVIQTTFLTATPPTLAFLTTYHWRVTARNFTADTPADQPIFTFTTAAAPPPPPGAFALVSPPDGATVGPDTVFEWTASDNADSYTVSFSTTADFSDPLLYEVLAPQTTLAIPLGALERCTDYFWTVVATNAGGTASIMSRTFYVPADARAPGVFALITPADGAIHVSIQPLLDWTAANSATEYLVEIDTDGTFDNPVVSTIVPAPSSSLQLSAVLIPGVTYHWRVTATAGCSLPRLSSPTSSSFTTIPPGPGAFALLSPLNGASDVDVGPQLVWSAASYAETYLVEIDTDVAFTAPVVSTVVAAPATSLDLPDDTLDHSKTYFWRVTAQNITDEHLSSPGLSAFTTASPPPTCTGDLDADGDTDVFDFAPFAIAFGATPIDPNWNPDADLLADGVIDGFDFSLFVLGFGCVVP